MTPLVTPIININGTDGITLFQQVDAICSAFHDLRLAMGKAMPHGRDYQTLTPGSGHLAREAYSERAVVLEEMEKGYLKVREELFLQLSVRGEWDYAKAMGHKERS
jgi:hypothetical protein